MNQSQPDGPPSFWKSPAGLSLLVAALVGGYFLLTEHRAHLFGALPYLLLLACPVMHLFMHKGPVTWQTTITMGITKQCLHPSPSAIR